MNRTIYPLVGSDNLAEIIDCDVYINKYANRYDCI